MALSKIHPLWLSKLFSGFRAPFCEKYGLFMKFARRWPISVSLAALHPLQGLCFLIWVKRPARRVRRHCQIIFESAIVFHFFSRFRIALPMAEVESLNSIAMIA
jgi:hypothetical protein